MATYLSGSGVKGDTVQTLYLMNPTSYTGYGESPNSSSMVVLNSATSLAGQGSPLGHPQQPQQHYAGFSIPQPVSHIGALSNPTMGHHSASPPEIMTNRMNSHYGWNGGGGNELLFMPASDLRDDNQSLSARLNSMNPGESSPVVSQLGMRGLGQSSFQEQVPYIPSGVALALSTADALQASTGAGQILSLSLSPQQPSLNQLQSFPIQHPELGIHSGPSYSDTAADSYATKADRFSNQWNGGNLNAFRASPTVLGSGLQDWMIGAANNNRLMLSSSPRVELYASKYLKPAQQLLIEVVSVSRAAKSGSTNPAKTQAWTTSNSFGSTFSQDKNLADSIGKDGGSVFGRVNEKDGAPASSTMPNDTGVNLEQNADNVMELTSAERQELQMKKAKLMAMLDEVDQRYRQYHHQMQIVVASFEATAGLGAARTYTALALQTISKHFRCLKDAIKGQIQVACKALGEEESLGNTRGETSRLRFIDQQLRQQRALQQLGMMQQHPWRPQRGLPERSVSVLRAWLFEHFLHPYPKDSDKVLLARQTGLTRNQVSNWFINARVRLWKPMVEEMYAEEMKDEEGTEDANKPSRVEGENTKKGVSLVDAVVGSGDTRKLDSKTEEQETELIQNKLLTGIVMPDSFLFQDKDHIGQSAVKRPRIDVIENAPFLSPNLSSNIDMKSYELHGSNGLAKLGENVQLGSYGIHQQEGLVQNHTGYGMFNSSGLSRYPDEGLVGTTYPTGSTGVSLTLGLQHSEGLSLAGSHQQPYSQDQGQLQVARGQEEGAVNYYSMHDIAAGGHRSTYETLSLQDRKRLASHLLQQDFS